MILNKWKAIYKINVVDGLVNRMLSKDTFMTLAKTLARS
jgi:hypothetical protein